MEKEFLTDFLISYAGSSPVRFHMPGHKGSRLYRSLGYGAFLDAFMDADITEIPGADDLFDRRGVLAELNERYRALYGSDASYALINGTSSGIQAAVMACAGCGSDCSGDAKGARHGKVIIAGNSHRSEIYGAELAGAEAVFVEPETFRGAVSAEQIEEALRRHPDTDAVLVISPSYYGCISDIRRIAEAVHSLGKPLIVDQAHGAHLKFFDEEYGTKTAAENLGADIVIDSTHKTLASMTQSSVAHIFGDRADREAFEEALKRFGSSSPSYILMASLDINADILEKHRKRLVKGWIEDLDWFMDAAKGIGGLELRRIPEGALSAADMLRAVQPQDPTKLLLDMSGKGFSGADLEKELRNRNIYAELADGDLVLCMTGIGNRRYDYEALIAALSEIGEKR